MARKEDIEKVRQILEVSEELSLRRKRQNESYRQTVDENRRADTVVAESKLRATGVVGLFESLRDEGVVKLVDYPEYDQKRKHTLFGSKLVSVRIRDYSPAEVCVYGGNVNIRFNETMGGVGGSSYVFAHLEGDSLIIEGEEKYIVDRDLSMVDAVGKALLRPKIIENVDWGRDKV